MKILAGQTVGIDLGTSYSALARLNKSGNPVVLNNAKGSPITQSVVVLGDDGIVRVGATENIERIDPEMRIAAIKRQMGNREYSKVYQNQRVTPEFISAMILRKLVQDAERQIGHIANAVITVPYYFNDPCRRATLEAGRIAGLNVMDIINEPTAATLAYAWMKGEFGRLDVKEREKTVLVYDLGGGTFDVTVVRYTPTHFEVVATDGDTFLGGLDWTGRLLDYACDAFQAKFHLDPRRDLRTLIALTEQCDDSKCELSETTQTLVTVTFEGKSTTVNVTRREFERLTADLLQRTRDTTELVLEFARVKPAELDEILLVGGSTYIPAVEQMLQTLCGRKPSRELNPQLAVAQGAAIHAAMLIAKELGGNGEMADAVIKRLKSVTTTDVNSHSLGVEVSAQGAVAAKKNHIMIPRNTRLPYAYRQRFFTNVPSPRGISIRLLEGEASDVSACTYIGDFRIVDLPAGLPVGSPVEVTYRYDARRRVHVSARELTGNRHASVEIVRDAGFHANAAEALRALAKEYRVE
ncbi:MAG: Hsp70 family protein [Planctomycetaceae bacterium]